MAVRDTSSAVNRVLCRQGYPSGGAGYILSSESCFMSTGLPKWRCGIHPQQGIVFYVDRVTQVAVRDTSSAGKRVLCRQGYPSGGAGYILSREALKRFGNRPAGKCSSANGDEDVKMGLCMEKLGVKAVFSKLLNPFAPKHYSNVSKTLPKRVALVHYTVVVLSTDIR